MSTKKIAILNRGLKNIQKQLNLIKKQDRPLAKEEALYKQLLKAVMLKRADLFLKQDGLTDARRLIEDVLTDLQAKPTKKL